MLRFISIYLFLLISNFCVGQNTVSNLNGYKYVYILPVSNYKGQDLFAVKYPLTNALSNSKMEIIRVQNNDDNGNQCLVLSCQIDIEPSGIRLSFINCQSKIVYESYGVLSNDSEKGLSKAMEEAVSEIRTFHHEYNARLGISAKGLRSGVSEEEIKDYLASNNLNSIEGIYKALNKNTSSFNQIGIIRTGTTFGAISLDLDNAFRNRGDLIAVFESTADPSIYSVFWTSHSKGIIETFVTLENEASLTVDLQSGEMENEKYVKIFPNGQRVKPNRENIRLSSGTGVTLSKEGLIVTNFHVIKNAAEIKGKFTKDGKGITYLLELLVVDEENDLALLKISDEKFAGFESIPFGIETIAVPGSSVFTIGFPKPQLMGTNYKVSNGIINSTTGIRDESNYYQIDVPIQAGNSGGPLFNKDGNVVGLTSGSLSGVGLQVVNYAVKAEFILQLAGKLPKQVQLTKQSKLSNKSLEEQVKVLTEFVCLIEVIGN